MQLSRRYLEFDEVLKSMAGWMTDENRARLGISDEEYNHFVGLIGDWSIARNAYKNPAAHTPAAVQAIRQAYEDNLLFVRNLRQQLKNNATIQLTADDYEKLFIHRDKTERTPINAPDFAPAAVLVQAEPLAASFKVSVPDSAAVNHRAVPKNMKIARKLAVLPKGTEPAASDYRPINATGRARFKLTFAPEQRGMAGWLICWYFNPRGKSGPESPPLKFPII